MLIPKHLYVPEPTMYIPEQQHPHTHPTHTQAVTECLHAAGPGRHILNVGHGVVQGTPEESVKLFCDLARESAAIHSAKSTSPALAMA